MKNGYRLYDIVLADFGEDVIGSEQGGVRPAMIIQNNKGNIHSSTTLAMPFTTEIKSPYLPTHSLFKPQNGNGLTEDSMLLGECIRQISEKRIKKYLGRISDKKDQLKANNVYYANLEG